MFSAWTWRVLRVSYWNFLPLKLFLLRVQPDSRKVTESALEDLQSSIDVQAEIKHEQY